MTDLEITRLCAEAMGIDSYWTPWRGVAGDYHSTPNSADCTIQDGKPISVRLRLDESAGRTHATIYDPLHDDAQAMALVKRFHLALGKPYERWIVGVTGRKDVGGRNENLNRAICECVAAMQSAKALA